MDTGGKVATGILVPVGIGIVALVSYKIYENHQQKKHNHKQFREEWKQHLLDIGTGPELMKELGYGGKRRTHRCRR